MFEDDASVAAAAKKSNRLRIVLEAILE